MRYGCYLRGEFIASGNHAKVYRGEDSDGKQLALKVEEPPEDSLRHEYAVMKLLARTAVDVPEVFDILRAGGQTIMAMELMGNTLQGVVKAPLPMPYVLQIAAQLITRFESIYAAGFIHGSVAPRNMAFGSGFGKRSNTVYLIDFGRTFPFLSVAGAHRPFAAHREPQRIGAFASTAGIAGDRLSRRDDLESLGYVLLYLARGGAPWQDQQTRRSAEALCKDLPTEFESYLDYVRNLGCAEKPDYSKLRDSFRQLRAQIATQDEIAEEARLIEEEERHVRMREEERLAQVRQRKRGGAKDLRRRHVRKEKESKRGRDGNVSGKRGGQPVRLKHKREQLKHMQRGQLKPKQREQPSSLK